MKNNLDYDYLVDKRADDIQLTRDAIKRLEQREQNERFRENVRTLATIFKFFGIFIGGALLISLLTSPFYYAESWINFIKGEFYKSDIGEIVSNSQELIDFGYKIPNDFYVENFETGLDESYDIGLNKGGVLYYSNANEDEIHEGTWSIDKTEKIITMKMGDIEYSTTGDWKVEVYSNERYYINEISDGTILEIKWIDPKLVKKAD